MSPSVGPAYDAAQLVIRALRSGARSSEEIRNWLNSVSHFQGVSNADLSFDERGLASATDGASVMRIAEGKRFVDVSL